MHDTAYTTPRPRALLLIAALALATIAVLAARPAHGTDAQLVRPLLEAAREAPDPELSLRIRLADRFDRVTPSQWALAGAIGARAVNCAAAYYAVDHGAREWNPAIRAFGDDPGSVAATCAGTGALALYAADKGMDAWDRRHASTKGRLPDEYRAAVWREFIFFYLTAAGYDIYQGRRAERCAEGAVGC